MSQKSCYEIAFENSFESGTMSFFAKSAEEADRQFVHWWEFRTDWLEEKLPVPSHWVCATWAVS
jgi:hypothetical protein